jgi:hypothetical protein
MIILGFAGIAHFVPINSRSFINSPSFTRTWFRRPAWHLKISPTPGVSWYARTAQATVNTKKNWVRFAKKTRPHL